MRSPIPLAEDQTCVRFTVPLGDGQLSVSWECVPKIEGDFHHWFLVESGRVYFNVNRIGSGETIFAGTLAMSGVEPGEITPVDFLVYATEDEDVWIDNLEFERCQ